MIDSVFISVPAWGAAYVDLAVRYTIPATIASLRAWKPDLRARFLVHTDDPRAFTPACAGHTVEFANVSLSPRTHQDVHWRAFKAAHKDAIARTTNGALLALLNSDIVVSIETFAAVEKALQGSKKVGVSVGIRTAIEGNVPPVGADAETLSRYIWSHRHPITDECVWGDGRTRHPTILFFPHDGPEQTVSMHCFHLTPMFVIKDQRLLNFNGTIDDDMLENYRPDETVYFRDREFAVAELSPRWKTHPFSEPLTVESVLDFGRRRFRPSHIRNFRERYRVLGHPPHNHPAVDAIIAGLTPR